MVAVARAYPPGFQVLAVSAGSVSHTGDTSETVLATVVIPGGSMGSNGVLRITALWSASPNNANNKTPRTRLGGIGGKILRQVSLPSLLSARECIQIQNRNAQNSQVGAASGAGAGGWNGAGAAVLTASVDTSTDQSLVFTGQLATGTDSITLESYIVEVLWMP